MTEPMHPKGSRVSEDSPVVLRRIAWQQPDIVFRPPDAEPVRLLVIEDDPNYGEIVRRFLEQTDQMVVELADTLACGLESLEHRRFDALLLDLTLPDSRGLETLREVRRKVPELPVVIVTGHDDSATAIEGLRCGAQDYIVKDEMTFHLLHRSIHYAIARSAWTRTDERYRAVVEDQTELICRCLGDGTLTFVNSAFSRFFACEAKALIGRDLSTLCAGEPALDPAGFEPGQALRQREQRLDVGGTTRWVQWTDRALFDAVGMLVEFQLVGRDVTRQKQLEQQLHQSQKMEILGHLASGLAHDFNNMLMVIAAHCDILARKRGTSGGSPEPELDEILYAIDRTRGLTGQLLALSRRQAVRRDVLDFNAVVARTEAMMRRVVGKHVRLELGLAPVPLWIRADAGQIEQILVNLLVNARDAMVGRGEILIETEELTRSESGLAGPAGVLKVSDTGHGMEPEILGKVFDPFFSTKDPNRGTGLGLTVVDSIVRANGGEIAVDSTPGQGTSFRIAFPLVAQTTSPGVQDAGGETTAEEGSGRVLLVEDLESVRSVIKRALTSRGYDVTATSSVREAMRWLEESPRPPEVLLSDVHLPDGDGGELAGVLHHRHPGARIVLMSGSGAVLAREGELAEADFLQKPFRIQELLSVLENRRTDPLTRKEKKV